MCCGLGGAEIDLRGWMDHAAVVVMPMPGRARRGGALGRDQDACRCVPGLGRALGGLAS